jgi:hypothetical protein
MGGRGSGTKSGTVTYGFFGGIFLMKKSSPREFFYVDMPVVQVYLRENLKIFAI